MTFIKDSKGKRGGGYERLFGDKQLGLLISRVQSAVIRTGYSLEKIILGLSNQVADLDSFLKQEHHKEHIFLVHKKVIQQSTLKSALEPDMLIFQTKKKHCYIIELKEGDNFDTKKARAEVDCLKEFERTLAKKIRYTTSIHICSFNQENKNLIVRGFKNKIDLEAAMTGRELCELLRLDYDAIVQGRKKNQAINMNFFIEELLKIEKVKALIEQKLPRAS